MFRIEVDEILIDEALLARRKGHEDCSLMSNDVVCFVMPGLVPA